MEKSTIPTDPEMIYDLQSKPADAGEEKRRTGGVNRLSFASHEKKFYRPESSASKTSTPSKEILLFSIPRLLDLTKKRKSTCLSKT
jgi:hypothetical protein